MCNRFYNRGLVEEARSRRQEAKVVRADFCGEEANWEGQT